MLKNPLSENCTRMHIDEKPITLPKVILKKITLPKVFLLLQMM
jgi:hypothetical protein